jgi:peptide deformylase
VPPHRASGELDDTPSGVQVLMNPIVKLLGEDIRPRWEGCLSIPGLRGQVPRHWRIFYAGVDAEGQPVAREASGFHANVVQHEYDHLDGILYPMRVTDFSSFGFTEELDRVAQAMALAGGVRP